MTSIAPLANIIRVQIHPQSIASILTFSQVDRSLFPVIVLLEAHVRSDSTLGEADNSTSLRKIERYVIKVMDIGG